MRKPTPTVMDFVDPDFLERGLFALQSEFGAWREAEDRGRRSLWILLGRIFELGDQVANNENARARLVSKANQNSNVAASNRWDARKKHPYELLLVLHLGLKEETKATKSQWLSALKAAAKAKVPTTQDAFISWIEELGGVEAARRSSAKPRQKNLGIAAFADQLEKLLDPDAKRLDLPIKFSDSDLPEGYGIVVVKQIGLGGEAVPIGTVANERQISAAIKTLLADQARAERQILNEMTAFEKAERSEMVARHKRFRAEFRRLPKTRKARSTLEEFLVEREVDHLLHQGDERFGIRNAQPIPSQQQRAEEQALRNLGLDS